MILWLILFLTVALEIYILYNKIYLKKNCDIIFPVFLILFALSLFPLSKEVSNYRLEALIEKHDKMVVCQQTIDRSFNEHIRFIYNEEVKEFNAEVRKTRKKNRNFFLGPFYPDVDKYIEEIDFNLRGE